MKNVEQKFAWLPTKVWIMTGKEYYDDYIWLCFYWQDTKELAKLRKELSLKFYRLTDDVDGGPMSYHQKVRTSTNTW